MLFNFIKVLSLNNIFRFASGRHGYPLPHGRRPQQRPPSHQERYGSQTQPSTRGEYLRSFTPSPWRRRPLRLNPPNILPAASDQTQQVCPGHDPRGLRLRSVREESHGAAEGVQGQEGAEVHQEEGERLV